MHSIYGAFARIIMHLKYDAFPSSAALSCIWCMWCIHVHYRMYAFWTWCIYMHLDAFECVAFACIPTLMHSCALPYVCILNEIHIDAFQCMQVCCILMHSNYDAFMCINSYSSPRRRNIARFGCAMRGAMIAWYLFRDCFIMRKNAWKYLKMRKNAHKCAGLVDHTYIHKRSRADSMLNSHGSMQHGPDGLRTGCDHVPM